MNTNHIEEVIAQLTRIANALEELANTPMSNTGPGPTDPPPE